MTEGKTILLVKPLVEGQPWYVQRLPKMINERTFELLIYLGDSQTVKGTQFLLTVATVPDQSTPEVFEPGSKLYDLPEHSTNKEVLLVRR